VGEENKTRDGLDTTSDNRSPGVLPGVPFKTPAKWVGLSENGVFCDIILCNSLSGIKVATNYINNVVKD